MHKASAYVKRHSVTYSERDERFVAMQETGIVLYCDILGYRTFLSENESITPAVEGVISILESAATESQKKTMETVKSLGDFAFLAEQRQARVFADTIIITMPLQDGDDDLHHTVRWVYLLTEAMVLHNHMLWHGLPVRGAVTVGNYYLTATCFAGKCIAEAHDEANDIQLSAVTITPKAFSSFLSATKMGEDGLLYEWLHRIIRTYPTPCKSGTHDKRLLLMATDILGAFHDDDDRAIAPIYRAFIQHNKHLDVSAEIKAHNTLAFMRFLTNAH